jgi:hypothetical protein
MTKELQHDLEQHLATRELPKNGQRFDEGVISSETTRGYWGGHRGTAYGHRTNGTNGDEQRR